MGVITVEIDLPEETANQLEQVAKELGRPICWIVEQALKEWFERELPSICHPQPARIDADTDGIANRTKEADWSDGLEREVICLPCEGQIEFAEALLNPGQPPDALIRALQAHAKRIEPGRTAGPEDTKDE